MGSVQQYYDEDLTLDDEWIWRELGQDNGCDYDFEDNGYRYNRPEWSNDDAERMDVYDPNWARLEGESAEAQSKRVASEEKASIDAYKAEFNRLDNDSQVETLDRLNPRKARFESVTGVACVLYQL